jgi:hypothetical protein
MGPIKEDYRIVFDLSLINRILIITEPTTTRGGLRPSSYKLKTGPGVLLGPSFCSDPATARRSCRGVGVAGVPGRPPAFAA